MLFGLLHFDQGWDVALAIGSLGLFWGVLYIKRRSAVMSMANHAGFNARQVAQVMIVRALGAWSARVNVLYFADTRFPIERANGVQTMETCHALAQRGHTSRSW